MSRAEELYQQAAAGSFQPEEYNTKNGLSTYSVYIVFTFSMPKRKTWRG